jgi:hypothetical protein
MRAGQTYASALGWYFVQRISWRSESIRCVVVHVHWVALRSTSWSVWLVRGDNVLWEWTHSVGSAANALLAVTESALVLARRGRYKREVGLRSHDENCGAYCWGSVYK